MAEEYYGRRGVPPHGQEMERLSASFAKLFSSAGGGIGGLQNNALSHHAPPNHHHSIRNSSVITQQPFGSQVSTTSSMGMMPLSWCPPQLPISPHHRNIPSHVQSRLPAPPPIQNSHHVDPPLDPHPAIGIPLPGLEILDSLHFIKVTDSGVLSGSFTCCPSYRILSGSGELVLRGRTSKLFCPFDARMKTVGLEDSAKACIFQIKFLPSICECDSEEKRCFAVFSPLYQNPFGAILFEAGQIKYSLRIINALEGETFAVQFLSSSDISIVGADGRILAIVNIVQRIGEKAKYSLTLTEEISTANKALFVACIITLDLVKCEGTCSKCICVCPFLVGTLTILGLTLATRP